MQRNINGHQFWHLALQHHTAELSALIFSCYDVFQSLDTAAGADPILSEVWSQFERKVTSEPFCSMRSLNETREIKGELWTSFITKLKFQTYVEQSKILSMHNSISKSRQRKWVYTLQLSLPVLAGQVGDLVWHVYVLVPYPVSIRGSLEFPFNFPGLEFIKKLTYSLGVQSHFFTLHQRFRISMAWWIFSLPAFSKWIKLLFLLV